MRSDVMIGKKRNLGKKIEELKIGDTYVSTYIVEDKDLLLYLGLTNDANPLYIQHDYASQTPYKQPIVPSVMLFGMISSVISIYLPGPGSHILRHNMVFPKPVYHQDEIKFTVEVIAIDSEKHIVTLSAICFASNGEKVMEGKLEVSPPYKPNSLTAQSLKNFF